MRYALITLLCLALLAMACGPAWLVHEPPADEELLVISPHWDGIRHEFGRAFAAHYLKTAGKRLRVTWLDIGGTGEIRKYLEERFKRARVDEGVGADVLFGGGMDMLPRMAADNYFERCPLPPELAHALPPSVNGQELRDKENRYHAACLSCFGFVYNTLVLEKAELPAPADWRDLGAPAYHGWVSCGDPTLSGSLHAAFEIVLQGQGWEHGYATVARLLSNVCAFNEGGSSVPRDVSLGQAAAGPCIDFYASAPIRRQGATHLRLVVPQRENVATPDCIAILRRPPNPAAARAFVLFVLGEAGQRLWYQARGTPGGPVDYDLERLPVMPAVYEMGLKTYTVTNPFSNAAAFQYNGKLGGERWTMLNDLWRAALIYAHEDLWRAHTAVLAARGTGTAGRDADLGPALARAPLSEEALLRLARQRLTADQRNGLQQRWLLWARAWYRAIERAAQENGAAPEFVAAPEN